MATLCRTVPCRARASHFCLCGRQRRERRREAAASFVPEGRLSRRLPPTATIVRMAKPRLSSPAYFQRASTWRWLVPSARSRGVETATTKPVQGRTEPKEVELTLLLSPKMFDLAKPLRVLHDGQPLFEGPVQRSLWALLVTVGRRNDPSQWFEASVTVREKPR